VLGCGLDDGVEFRQGLGIFLCTTAFRPVLGRTQHPEAYLLGIKRPEREADHSSQSSAQVKDAWNYTSTPRYAFMAWCSVKAQGQLYLLPSYLCLIPLIIYFVTLFPLRIGWKDDSVDEMERVCKEVVVVYLKYCRMYHVKLKKTRRNVIQDGLLQDRELKPTVFQFE
jgi:hypothetical protein